MPGIRKVLHMHVDLRKEEARNYYVTTIRGDQSQCNLTSSTLVTSVTAEQQWTISEGQSSSSSSSNDDNVFAPASSLLSPPSQFILLRFIIIITIANTHFPCHNQRCYNRINFYDYHCIFCHNQQCICNLKCVLQ